MPQDTRPLGQTGLQVTNLCIGTASLGDMPETFDYSVPEDRALATLRAAFDATMKDPGFLADAEHQHLTVHPTAGPAAEKVVAHIGTAKPEIIALAKRVTD